MAGESLSNKVSLNPYKIRSEQLILMKLNLQIKSLIKICKRPVQNLLIGHSENNWGHVQVIDDLSVIKEVNLVAQIKKLVEY